MLLYDNDGGEEDVEENGAQFDEMEIKEEKLSEKVINALTSLEFLNFFLSDEFCDCTCVIALAHCLLQLTRRPPN
jgi:hypothetical protein